MKTHLRIIVASRGVICFGRTAFTLFSAALIDSSHPSIPYHMKRFRLATCCKSMQSTVWRNLLHLKVPRQSSSDIDAEFKPSVRREKFLTPSFVQFALSGKLDHLESFRVRVRPSSQDAAIQVLTKLSELKRLQLFWDSWPSQVVANKELGSLRLLQATQIFEKLTVVKLHSWAHLADKAGLLAIAQCLRSVRVLHFPHKGPCDSGAWIAFTDALTDQLEELALGVGLRSFPKFRHIFQFTPPPPPPPRVSLSRQA